MALELTEQLIEHLDSRKILYCHWKSNLYLEETLNGERDLDLLVDRCDAQRFEAVLGELGLKRVVDSEKTFLPGVEHFYGLDHPTATFVHVHVYFQIITGDSVGKNYRLPLERPLLQDRRKLHGVYVPSSPAELMIFTIRTMLKHTSLLDYILLRRHYREVQQELAYILRDETVVTEAVALVQKYLCSVDCSLFSECVHALTEDTALHHRVHLALKLRRQLDTLRRQSLVVELWQQGDFVVRHLVRHFRKAKRTKKIANGGIIIAFVGPEATGKSTAVREMDLWLGSTYQLYSCHLGKPPATWLSFFPNLGLSLLRKHTRLNFRNASQTPAYIDPGNDSIPSLLYSIRAVLVAWDRYKAALAIHRKAANGAITICDRYPSMILGAMDSPRLLMAANESWPNGLKRYLAKIERTLYKRIPPPNVVVHLTVPLEIAIERNRIRAKPNESDEYIVQRHKTKSVPEFPTARTIYLNTAQDKAETLSQIRRILWEVL